MVLAQLRLFGHPGFDGELVGEGTEAGDRLSGFRRRRRRRVGEQSSSGVFRSVRW